jgi:hypothetical protein
MYVLRGRDEKNTTRDDDRTTVKENMGHVVFAVMCTRSRLEENIRKITALGRITPEIC